MVESIMRGENMKIQRWFLIAFIGFLFCILVSIPLQAQENLSAIVKKIEPSVVVILTYDIVGKVHTQGTGFFINDRGDVITNWHVIQGANRAEIRTADGKVYPIKVVLAVDEEVDLIRVRVEIPPNVVRPMSVSSYIPEVGERIIVVGSPLGLERTVSDGIVSQVRDIPTFGKMLQITAPISKGSSGSPVLNMKGEVIGVATFQIIEGQNINFAIPGKKVLDLKPDKGQTLSELKGGSIEEWPYLKGLILIWIEDYEKALTYFKEAIKKDPRDYEAYSKIGYCNVKLKRYIEAVEAFKQSIQMNPNFAEAYRGLGSAYWMFNRYHEAAEFFKKATYLEPDDARAHFGLGYSYRNLLRWNEAIQCYKQAIHIDPEFFGAYAGLSWVYVQLERWNEALEVNKQMVRIKPDDAQAHFGLGLIYSYVGDRDSALKEYKILKDLDKDLANKLFNFIYK